SPVDPPLEAWMHSKRLQLGAEDKIAPGPAIIKWLLPEPVADQAECALTPVPQCEGEHASTSAQGFDEAPGRNPFEEHLNVRMAPPAACGHCAGLLKLGPQVPVIVNLAIHGEHEAAVGGDHRLVPG